MGGWSLGSQGVTESAPFDPAAFDRQLSGSGRSAAVVVPLVLDLLPVTSVVDFGAGKGAWLAAFAGHGVTDYLGLEGGHPSDEQLQIPPDRMRNLDLSRPVDLGRKFDLAVSLEVGEHIPETNAATFVESLTRHADTVLFSAAIPNQGGHAHINERWPTYWAEMFAGHGFRCYDPFRRRLWTDERVEWFYAQNLLVYSTRDLGDAAEPMSLVHPALYARMVELRGSPRFLRSWVGRRLS